MNGIPPFVRAIAIVLIGLPGGIMWVVGMVSSLFACWKLREVLTLPWDGVLLCLAGPVVLSAIGFSMVAAAEMLGGARRYRMPASRLPSYLGWELLEGFLAVGFVGTILAAISSFATGGLAAGTSWILMGVVVAFLLVATHRTSRLKGRTWREELIETPPRPEPEADL